MASEGVRATVEAVLDRLEARGETLGTAESLTGGLLGAALTAVPGSSASYRGGVVAYATELKHQLLGVDAEALRRDGAVHERTALAMADGARTRLGSTWGLATTGVAGPDPQEGHPAGLVHVGVSGPRGREVRTLRLPGGRAEVREATVDAALGLLAGVLGTGESSVPAAG